jgi:hypothetical protein
MAVSRLPDRLVFMVGATIAPARGEASGRRGAANGFDPDSSAFPPLARPKILS